MARRRRGETYWRIIGYRAAGAANTQLTFSRQRCVEAQCHNYQNCDHNAVISVFHARADNSLRIVAPDGPYRLQDLLARPVQRANMISVSHIGVCRKLHAGSTRWYTDIMLAMMISTSTASIVHDELGTWPSCRRERERGEERAFGIHVRRDCSDHERQARPAGRTSGQHDDLPRGRKDLRIAKNYRKKL